MNRGNEVLVTRHYTSKDRKCLPAGRPLTKPTKGRGTRSCAALVDIWKTCFLGVIKCDCILERGPGELSR